MKRSFLFPVLFFGISACASNPEPDSPLLPPTRTDPQPQIQRMGALEPVGNYEFATVVDGQSVAGTINISRTTEGKLVARVSTDLTGDIPISSVTVEGSRVTMTGNMPDGQLGFTMEFKNSNEFSGSWSYAGMSGAFDGKRKA